MVLLEDSSGFFLGQSALNDAELAEPLGNFQRFGESDDVAADRVGDGLWVPVGAEKPFQDANSKPGTVSDTDGMSSAAGIRFAVPTAINLILSLLMCGSSAEELPK